MLPLMAMEKSNGHAPPTDLIDLWMAFTTGRQTPEHFRLWTGISLIAGALERRVWAVYGDYRQYANMYIMLVAPPGVGKSVVELVRHVWADTKQLDSTIPAFHTASDSVSRASLMDELAAARQVRILPAGPPLVYHSLQVAAEEMEVLLPGYDPEFVSSLNSIWNNKAVHRERRRTSTVKWLEIVEPQINLLAGAQPAYLARVFPDEVWRTGISRRLMMIYANKGPVIDIFAPRRDTSHLRLELLAELSCVSALSGPMHWEPAASEWLRDWYLSGRKPEPTHSKLSAYNTTRHETLIRLCMISAIAARRELIIREADLERARRWLLDAEMRMPDVFRDMVGKSDREIIDELHRFVMSRWGHKAGEHHPVPGFEVRRFLYDRTPSDKMEGLIAAAERMKVIVRPTGTGDLWIPGERPGQTE